jgi:ribosomal protein S27AE
MSKDLKDLIEIVKLNKKLKEKTPLTKIGFVKPAEEINESEEINILKSLIASQKQELAGKIRETEVLQKKMEDINLELKNVRDTFTDSVKDQVLIKTQNSLNNLIEDYGRLEEQLETEIYGLKRQLNDFERSKKILEDNIQTLKSKQSSAIELENALESLENRNIELNEEKQQLKKEIKAAKTELFNFSKKEERVSDLKTKIEELKKENIILKEKDTLLLAKTITAINVQQKREHRPVLKDTSSKAEEVSEVYLEVKQEKPKEEIKVLLQKPEIKSDLITTDTKMDLIQTSETEELGIKDEIPIEPSKEIVIRKKKCPNCGNTNKSQIREVDDKTRLIYTYPKIYAKKYKCGQCGAEWHK